MTKLLFFVKRKSGLSLDQFREHWEKVHAPIAEQTMPGLVGYARNYLEPFPGRPEPPFDCACELEFDGEAGLTAAMAWMRSEGGQMLFRDEENFMDRSKTVVTRADQRRSVLPHRR
jgi:uncharacterized protein (TIGR02118 family)